uniref:50S ribosomal protein L35 n=1 Tax=Syphacia muris TaxID=451379 RepID=A0A0N5APG0_9BILA
MPKFLINKTDSQFKGSAVSSKKCAKFGVLSNAKCGKKATNAFVGSWVLPSVPLTVSHRRIPASLSNWNSRRNVPINILHNSKSHSQHIFGISKSVSRSKPKHIKILRDIREVNPVNSKIRKIFGKAPTPRRWRRKLQYTKAKARQMRLRSAFGSRRLMARRRRQRKVKRAKSQGTKNISRKMPIYHLKRRHNGYSHRILRNLSQRQSY